jgi:SAM-dependent methyltransferase
VLCAEVTAFVRAALPAAPARVLEVGAGAGELAHELTAAGYEVVAIDPEPGSPAVRRMALHELDEPAASFDAAVAVLSLHHVAPLAESCRRLGELVRAHGRLVVDEFDVARFDERAARWWLEHGGADSQDEAADAGTLVADLREHLHTVDRLREELDAWFTLAEPVRGPYLHRWDLPPGLREVEERLIAAGRLPATGARLVGPRRSL